MGDVLAGRPHIGAALEARWKHHAALFVEPHVLLHEHRIALGRHRRTGEDADGLAGLYRFAGRHPRLHPRGDDKGALIVGREILSAHRVSVDRRVGERRQVQGRHEVLRQHPPVGIGQGRQLDSLHRAQLGDDQGDGFVHRPHGAAEREAVIGKLRHGPDIVGGGRRSKGGGSPSPRTGGVRGDQ